MVSDGHGNDGKRWEGLMLADNGHYQQQYLAGGFGCIFDLLGMVYQLARHFLGDVWNHQPAIALRGICWNQTWKTCLFVLMARTTQSGFGAPGFATDSKLGDDSWKRRLCNWPQKGQVLLCGAIWGAKIESTQWSIYLPVFRPNI